MAGYPRADITLGSGSGRGSIRPKGDVRIDRLFFRA